MPVDELRFEIEDLYHSYVECLDEDTLESWPGFFTEECVYKIIPRENWDQGLPLALMLCESRGMLLDRVEALRRASVYAPRSLRHFLSGIRLRRREGEELHVQASYVVLQTLCGEETKVFNAGRYIDRLVRQDGKLLFREKLCVFDSVLVPGSLIYPL